MDADDSADLDSSGDHHVPTATPQLLRALRTVAEALPSVPSNHISLCFMLWTVDLRRSRGKSTLGRPGASHDDIRAVLDNAGLEIDAQAHTLTCTRSHARAHVHALTCLQGGGEA